MRRAHGLMAAALLGAFALAAPTAARAGDAAAGAKVFKTQCAECHSVVEGKDKKGPSLYATYGAKSGGNAGFIYSDAFRAVELTWTPETLATFLATPKKVIPGNKMKFDGLDDATQRDDLIAYLASMKP